MSETVSGLSQLDIVLQRTPQHFNSLQRKLGGMRVTKIEIFSYRDMHNYFFSQTELGTTQRDGMGREEGSGWGTHVYLWRIHFDIWQN